MNQKERLDYLVSAFQQDSTEYRNLEISDNTEEKKAVLRSLMNIRMPKPMQSHVIKIQDEYLRKRNEENGIVSLDMIPTLQQLGSTHESANVLSIWQGDITRLSVDAVVNAANNQMLGCFIPMHTCIDNCIHTYAGIQLREECYRKMKQLRMKYGNDYVQPVGVPMLTGGYNLPAKHVIHVVGPIVSGFVTKQNEQDLKAAYRNVLDMCCHNDLRTVAFCCISTGVFHYPGHKAAKTAVETVCEWLKDNPDTMDRIIFNVFKDEDKRYYEKELC